MKWNSSRVNLKDLIDFVHQFMYWAASHLADRTEFLNILKKKKRERDFYRQRKWVKEVRLVKRRLVVSRSHSFREWQGSVRQITSLMLIDWLKIVFLLLNKQVPVPNLDLLVQTPKHWSLEQRKIYCRVMQGEQVTHAPKILTPGRVSQSIFKGQIGGGASQDVWSGHSEFSDWLMLR